jgi:hypothetical protein
MKETSAVDAEEMPATVLTASVNHVRRKTMMPMEKIVTIQTTTKAWILKKTTRVKRLLTSFKEKRHE